MSSHPYQGLPASAFWSTAVAGCEPGGLHGIYEPRFPLDRSTGIATAGSCFAQHIGRHLVGAGCNVIDVEPAPGRLPVGKRAAFGFSLYSARYGNIYSVHRLLQLAQEALGSWTPHDICWERDGRFYDALRPGVEPQGLDTPEEVYLHRRQHLQRVRDLFGRMDVLVLTLGLTEAWRSRQHGTVYTMAPGVRSGVFDPDRYEFVNYGFIEIEAAFAAFLETLKALRNGRAVPKIILTVSPVPLAATASGTHVLQASTYSKAVLRSICGHLRTTHADIDYFPSYEIVVNPANRSGFFDDGLRQVTPRGVDAVMQIFLEAHRLAPGRGDSGPDRTGAGVLVAAAADRATVCEDAILEAFAR